MLQELFLAARPSDLRFGGDFLGVFFFFGDGSAGSSSLSTTGALRLTLSVPSRSKTEHVRR